MAHKLKIIVEDILQDENYIRVIDWSVYDNRMSVTNRVMKVEIPGVTDFKLVPFSISDSTVYSSKSLKLDKGLRALPDGLWSFTYSICPNERKFVTVNHFRCVELEMRIMSALSKLAGTKGYTPEIQNNLVNCIVNIHALKTNAIDKYNTQKAYDLYADTNRLFDNLSKLIQNV